MRTRRGTEVKHSSQHDHPIFVGSCSACWTHVGTPKVLNRLSAVGVPKEGKLRRVSSRNWARALLVARSQKLLMSGVLVHSVVWAAQTLTMSVSELDALSWSRSTSLCRAQQTLLWHLRSPIVVEAPSSQRGALPVGWLRCPSPLPAQPQQKQPLLFMLTCNSPGGLSIVRWLCRDSLLFRLAFAFADDS